MDKKLINLRLLVSEPLAFFIAIEREPILKSFAFYFALSYPIFALTIAGQNWLWEQLLGVKIFPSLADWILLPLFVLVIGLLASLFCQLMVFKTSSFRNIAKAGIYSLIPFVFLWMFGRVIYLILFWLGAGEILITIELGIDIIGIGWTIWILSCGIIAYHKFERKFAIPISFISYIASCF